MTQVYAIILVAMENETTPTEIQAVTPTQPAPEAAKTNKAAIIGITIGLLILVAAMVAFAVFLITGEGETTARIRDVFIISWPWNPW